MIPRRLHDLPHPLIAADIAGVDPQAGRTAFGGLDRAAVMEMDVGDDRHVHLAHDILQRQRAGLVGTGDPDNIDPRRLSAADLRHGAGDIGRQRVGHGLHGDRRAVAHRDLADIDPARLAALDFLIGAIAHAELLQRPVRPGSTIASRQPEQRSRPSARPGPTARPSAPNPAHRSPERRRHRPEFR